MAAELGQQSLLRLLNPLSAPPATKAIAFVLILIYVVSIRTSWLDNPLQYGLGLVPAKTITSFFIWNIFTAGFWHSSLLDLLGNVGIHLMAGKYLETIWGSREFVKFIAIVNLLCGVTTFAVLVGLFLATGEESDWFPEVPFGGYGGVACAFAVALKQLVPEIEMPILGGIGGMGIRFKFLPAIFLGTGLLFHFLHLPSTYVLYTVCGLAYSWLYLRFFQARDGFTGDLSDQFAFVTFFPGPIATILSPVSTIIWKLFGSILTSRREQQQQQQQPRSVDISKYSGFSVLDQPGDAERRRALGLKALDARMASIKSSPAPKQNALVSSVLSMQPGIPLPGITTTASIDVAVPATPEKQDVV